MSTDPESLNPGTRRSRVPGWWDPLIVRILGQVTQFWQSILYLYFSTGSWKLFWYLLSGIQCQRKAGWVAAKSGNLWSGALHTATITTTNASAFNYTSRHMGDNKMNPTSFVAVVIFIPHKLHLLPVHCCSRVLYFVCSDVGWCQLAWGTMETRFAFILIVKWTLLSACFLPAKEWHKFAF